MKRRWRALRVAKLGGMTTCVLIVATYFWSNWRMWSWGGSGGYVEIREGVIHLEHHRYPLPFPQGRRGWWVSRNSQPWKNWNSRLALVPSLHFYDDTIRVNGKPFRRRATSIVIPFWLVLVPAAGLALLLWRRDRRRPRPGHCPCGYDLTGNESGVCPECGAATD